MRMCHSWEQGCSLRFRCCVYGSCASGGLIQDRGCVYAAPSLNHELHMGLHWWRPHVVSTVLSASELPSTCSVIEWYRWMHEKIQLFFFLFFYHQRSSKARLTLNCKEPDKDDINPTSLLVFQAQNWPKSRVIVLKHVCAFAESGGPASIYHPGNCQRLERPPALLLFLEEAVA